MNIEHAQKRESSSKWCLCLYQCFKPSLGFQRENDMVLQTACACIGNKDFTSELCEIPPFFTKVPVSSQSHMLSLSQYKHRSKHPYAMMTHTKQNPPHQAWGIGDTEAKALELHTKNTFTLSAYPSLAHAQAADTLAP